MSTEVAKLITKAKIIAEEFQQTFGHLSEKQLNRKPNENDWSIAQCIEHLIITNDLYFENIQKLADGTHRNNIFSYIPVAPLFTALVMKKVLSPDWRKKMKTLKMFKPSQSDISENILKEFATNQQRFISLMEATKAMDVRKIKVAEPISIAVNLRLIDAFEILLVHEKRHFQQAQRILEIEELPN
jgi:hypothetical protein